MEESGGEAASTRQSVTSSCQPWSTDACQKMAGKLAGLTAKQRDLQRFLGSLASEQEAFLREMRTFSDVGQLWEPSAVRRSQARLAQQAWKILPAHPRNSGLRISADSGHLQDSGAKSRQAKSATAEQPARKVSAAPGDPPSSVVAFADVLHRPPASDAPSSAVASAPVEGGHRPPAKEAAAGGTSSAPLNPARSDTVAPVRSTFAAAAARSASNVHDDRVTMSTAHLKAELTNMFKHSTSERSLVAHGWADKVKSFARRTLYSQYFEATIGVIIFINVVNIGWAIEAEIKKQDTSVQTVIEVSIVVIFWAELLLVFLVHGIVALKQKWNLFDFAINLVTTLVLIFVSFAEPDESGTLAELMKKMIILRMIRLLRLFRAVRLIQMSRSLWKLVQGLKQCLGTMIAAAILTGIALYFFACFGAELITKAYAGDPVVGGIIDKNMSSIPRIMLTLFQFISMDSTADIYVTLIHRNPWFMIYFLLIVFLVSIMLMNLITAVIVEDAITTATMDKDLKVHLLRDKLKSLRPAFEDLFNDLDVNGDGTVHIQEIVTAVEQGLTIPECIQDLVTPPRMLDLFDLLDQDNSGELTESEFVDGMSCLALSDVPLETMQILHLLRLLRRDLNGLGLGWFPDLDLEGGSQDEEGLDGDERHKGSLVLRENI